MKMTEKECIELLQKEATVESMYKISDSMDVEDYKFYVDNCNISEESCNDFIKNCIFKHLSNIDGIKISHVFSILYNDKTQFYISLYTGKNGATKNFASEVLLNVYYFLNKTIEYGADWCCITDYKADIIDDLYDWVVTFTVPHK